jgi:hypothetical protein
MASSLHMVFIGKVKAYGEKIKTFVAENKMQNRIFSKHPYFDYFYLLYL